jgi:hypothetical protein
MKEIQLPLVRKEHEIRPGKRDFGYILIGLALGIAVGGIAREADGTFLIIFTIGLSLCGGSLIRSSLR